MATLPKTETSIVALVKRHVSSSVPRGEFWDEAIKGLSLVVGARSASWFALYVDGGGKRKRARLGTFMHPATGGERAPYMGLAEAREAFALLKGDARQARDPYSRKQASKDSPTVSALADDFLAKHASQIATGDQYRRILRNDVVPEIGNKRLLELSRRDVHAVLDRVAKRGAPIMANRTLEVMRKMFSWAVERDLMPTNPAVGVSKPSPARASSRVLSSSELKALWKVLDQWDEIDGLAESVADEFRLLLLTGAREREIGGARWDEVDFDGCTLTLPADIAGRSKSRDHPHIVPLCPQAVTILKRLKLRAGRSAFIFPSPLTRDKDRAASQSRVENAKAVIDKALLDRSGLFDPSWTIHDLRRTVRSRLSELKVPPHIAELVIGHSLRGVVKIYDRYDYLDEKRDALERWGDCLARIVTGAPAPRHELVADAS